MIEFEEGRIPEKRLSTLTAYVSDAELMSYGKNLVRTVIHELIKQSVLMHRIDIENMITNDIISSETREYIKSKIRETIDKCIQEEVEKIFRKSE